MFVCDGCQHEFDFLMIICGLALCNECLKPYDDALSECQSHKELDIVGRRIRSDILSFRKGERVNKCFRE